MEKKANTLVVIDTKEIVLARNEAGKAMMTPQAEKALLILLDLKRRIDIVYEEVSNKLDKALTKEGLTKLNVGEVSIAKKLFGGRYKVAEGIKPDQKFLKITEWIRPNGQTIERFIEENNKLPEGIELNNRTEKLLITKRKEIETGEKTI